MEWNNEILLLLTIPLVSAVVGWVTNWMAVKMMFYPIEFVGIPPIFGWQGVIPSKREEMAKIEVELVLGKLLTVEELADRLDSEQLTAAIDRRLKQVLKRTINKVMQEGAPQIWAALPVQGKELVYARVEEDMPKVVQQLVSDFQHNVHEILNIEELVIEQLRDAPELLNELFLTAGEQEFKFIVKSGFLFGFLFGLPTMFFWAFYEAWWILPVGGLLVGYLTNWIALKIIFEPLEPKKIGPFYFQGRFLKRQFEVSRIYADLIGAKVITPQNIASSIFNGTGSTALLELIELNVNDAIDRYISMTQPYFALSSGSDKYFKMKEMAVREIFENSESMLYYAYDYADQAMNISDDLCTRMQALTPAEFEGVLRPAYQADEWKLIIVGALLGMGAGVAQLFWLFI